MAAKSVRFSLPLTTQSFSNALLPAKKNRLIRSLNTGSQKAHEPAAAFSRSRCSGEEDWNTATRVEVRKRALADDDDESDDDFPPLEELLHTAQPPNTSTKASKTERTLQHLNQPALNGARMQVDQTKSLSNKSHGDSRDQPMILDDDESDESDEAGPRDEAETVSGDVDAKRIQRDASPYSILTTSELASGPAKSVDVSGLWYDVEEGCYIDERAPTLESREQQGVPSVLRPDQPRTLPQSSTPLQDQISQQDIGDIIQSTPVESAPHSLPEPSDNGDDGWTEDSMAEFEKEVRRALVEQVKPSSASTPNSLRPRSVEASQDESQNQGHSETTCSKPEESRGASRPGTPAHGLEECVQRQIRVMAETLRELQKEELGRPALGDQQDVDLGEPSWINEDQSRISLIPTLLDELRASSPYSLSQAESEVHLRHVAAPINDEHRYTPRASRSPSDPSVPAGLTLRGEPEQGKWGEKLGHHDTQKEIGRDIHHSINTIYNHTCDTDDEDPRPAKRRKPQSVPTATPVLCRERAPNLCLSRPRRLSSSSSMQIETGDVQSHTPPSTFMDDKEHDTPSRSPSATAESIPSAEYQEWPLRGFLKRTRIGKETTFNLEFHLTHLPEDLELSAPFAALGSSFSAETSSQPQVSHSAVAHSKMHHVVSQPSMKRVKWTEEEDATLVRMRKDGSSWEDIHAALPHRTQGTIQVRYSTKLKK